MSINTSFRLIHYIWNMAIRMRLSITATGVCRSVDDSGRSNYGSNWQTDGFNREPNQLEFVYVLIH